MKKQCARRGSSPRPSDCEVDALPSPPQEHMIVRADLQIPIPLCAQCVFFSVAFSGISMYPAYTLSTRAFFFGPNPCIQMLLSEKQIKKSGLSR